MTDRLPSIAASKPEQWPPVLYWGCEGWEWGTGLSPAVTFRSSLLIGLWSERPERPRVHTNTQQTVWL